MEGVTDPPAARPNGRPSTQLHINKDGRKPLFTSASTSKDNGGGGAQKKDVADRAATTKPELARYRPPHQTSGDAPTGLLARRTNSESMPTPRRGSNASSGAASPGGSRIPKPTTSTFSHRKPLSIDEAMKMAVEEEGRVLADDDDDQLSIDASPSPAPRTWRTRRDTEPNTQREGMAGDRMDTKTPSKLPVSRSGNAHEMAEPTVGPVGEKISPLKAGSVATEAGGELSKVTGNERPSWRNRLDWRSRPKTGSEWSKEHGSAGEETNGGATIPDLVPGIEDMPLPSVESDGQPRAARSPSPRSSTAAKNASPEKSFTWQVDEDFTAGDLQVSNSPRIKVDSRPFANRFPFDESSEVDINSKTRVNHPGSQNTKLDEIRSREVKAGNNIPLGRSLSRTRNTKLDDIRARETEVEKQIPIPNRHLTASRNTKLDDIRKREEEGLSKRQLAAARLEEIREQNAMSRSKSPVEARHVASPQSARDTRKTAGGVDAEIRRDNRPGSQWGAGGERVPDTPVTVFKGRRANNGDPDGDAATTRGGDEGKPARPGLSHRRADSRDLLRQLARAASSSPAAEPQPKSTLPASRRTEKNVTDSSARATRGPRRALTTANLGGGRRPNNNNTNRDAARTRNGNSRPTVEFAGLRRVRSTESTRSKRSSQSEMDPTDRIEAEMKLFAPLDNHSEKGSVRAPSPAPGSKKDESENEADVDATPKVKKEDPLTMPTPKVVGAYVETPATVKVERIEVPGIDEKAGRQQDGARSTRSEHLASLRGRRARRTRDSDTASEPGEDEKPSATTTSAAASRRRARSLSRHRPPLKNTAKLPSVKDDLLELQKMYNIDDNTLDNLEEVISGRKAPSLRLEALLQDLPTDAVCDDDSFDLELERMSEIGDSRVNNEAKSPRRKKRSTSEGDLEAYDRMSRSLRTGLLGIRSAKQGIERLEDNLSHTQHLRAKSDKNAKTQDHVQPEKHEQKQHKQQRQPDVSVPPLPGTVAYIYLPVPRLYTLRPRFRLTWLGLITLITVLWYTIESAMCSLYCAPTSCTSTPCVWSYDDPTFGKALPVKLDQWTTGGLGRTVVNSALEEAEDWMADVLDMAYGRDIRDVDVESLSFEGKRAHRRRLRKKGLATPRGLQAEQEAGPEVRARWEAWHRERLAREKAREAGAMGYAPLVGEEESIGGDQRIW